METAEREKKLKAIKNFVLKERKRCGITRLGGPLPELSCEAFGEFHNLLFRGLLHTPEEEWAGNERIYLRDDNILNGAYLEVLRNSL